MKDYKIEARLQKGWNWMVAVYLFLGGVGSGAYVFGAFAGFMGWPDLAKIGVVLSLPTVVIGTLFLVAHLGSPLHAYLTPSKVKTSWISRGVIFISLFMLFSFIHIIAIFMGKGADQGINFVAVLGIICALGTMLYTGALLSASKGVPFWESGIMPVLFMFSALVTGLFSVLLINNLGVGGPIDPVVAEKLALIALGLLVGEAVVLFFFLYSAYQLPGSKDPVVMLLHKPSFVYGDVVLGLLVPILLMLAVIAAKGGGGTSGMIILAGMLALIGGMLLRFGIVSVGMRASYNISGFEFRLNTKLDPKTMVGKVPPGNI